MSPRKPAELTEIGKRIEDLRIKRNQMSRDVIAQAMGWASGQSLFDFQRGLLKELSDERWDALAEKLGTTRRYLENGEGPMDRPAPIWEPTKDPTLVYVPLVNKNFSLGPGIDDQSPLESIKDLAFRRQWFVDKVGDKPEGVVYAAKVIGHSMTPELLDGDVVLIDTSRTEALEGKLYALWTAGGRKVKRLRETSPDVWTAISTNTKAKDSDPFELDEGDRIEGLVLWRGGEV